MMMMIVQILVIWRYGMNLICENSRRNGSLKLKFEKIEFGKVWTRKYWRRSNVEFKNNNNNNNNDDSSNSHDMTRV